MPNPRELYSLPILKQFPHEYKFLSFPLCVSQLELLHNQAECAHEVVGGTIAGLQGPEYNKSTITPGSSQLPSRYSLSSRVAVAFFLPHRLFWSPGHVHYC